MKRFSKALFSFAGACLVAGFVLCIVGFALGGRARNLSLWHNGPAFFHFDFDALTQWDEEENCGHTGAGRAEVIKSEDIAGVYSLDINVAAGSVHLCEGDGFSVKATAHDGNVPEYSWGTERETFYLKTDNADPSLLKKVTFTVTIPQGIEFGTAHLATDVGSLKVEGLTCREGVFSTDMGSLELYDTNCTEKADISVDVGSVELKGSLAGDIHVNCGMGSAQLHIARPQAYGYHVQCGMGSVDIGEASFGGFGADTSARTDAPTVFDLACGMGDIEVNFL